MCKKDTHSEGPRQLSPAQRALVDKFLRETNSFRRDELPAITRDAESDRAPLSFGQHRIWFFEQLEPLSLVYNRPSNCRLIGSLNIDSLARSLNAIAWRHEILRARVESHDGIPFQVISPAELSLSLPLTDLRNLSTADCEAATREITSGEALRPFNLSDGPLLRARLLRLRDHEHLLLLTFHHIVFDGSSVGLFLREFGAFYAAFSEGSDPVLPALPIQYADYARWQRAEFQQSQPANRQLAYWKGQLANAPIPLQLQGRTQPPSQRAFSGAEHLLYLDQSLTETLKELGRREGATLFMTVLAGLQTLIYSYTAQKDVIVGAPIAGRTRVETETLIGCFINTLALRTDLSGDPTFREVVQRAKRTALDGYTNQDLPYEKVVEELQPDRNVSRNPFFQVMLNFRNSQQRSIRAGSLDVEICEPERQTALEDLTLDITERPEGLRCLFQYNLSAFDSESIAHLARHFETLLRRMAEDPDVKLSALPALDEAEYSDAAARSKSDHRNNPLGPEMRNPIRRTATDKRSYPASFAQERLWFLDQLDPESSVYNIPGAYRFTGPLNVDTLERALREVCSRHEILRTEFSTEGGRPIQIVQTDSEISLPVADLTSISDIDRERVARQLAYEECAVPFDLNRGPLWRIKLLRLGAEEHVLLVIIHHIVSDGWSLGLFMHELASLYSSFSENLPHTLPALPCQYGDYAVRQREWLQDERIQEQLTYWREQVGGELPVLELLTDRPRPATQTFNGATTVFTFPKTLSDGLAALSRREGVTQFMTLLATFKTLLHRYTGQEDILVGAPIAGRNRFEGEKLIGFFVNTLALRTDLSGDPTFRELLARVREVSLGAFDNQDLPFGKLVEHLQPERSLSHTPIFQVMFQLNQLTLEPISAAALNIAEFEFDSRAAKFDLSLEMSQQSNSLKARLAYNTDLFDDDTITRMLGHFQVLLKAIVSNPQQRLSTLPLLTEAERNQILVEWNDTATDYPRGKTIQRLFEEQAREHPETIAVISENASLTYAQLNARANKIAHLLLQQGVKHEAQIGVCLERSAEMLEAILGILKAGCAYVPLDPSFPPDRLSFLLNDANISVVLTQERLRRHLSCSHKLVTLAIDSETEALNLQSEENPSREGTGDDLAYIMYTSGSTGMPKGVLVNHRGVVRLVRNTNYAELDADQVFLQFAPLSFDASTFEIWGCLLNGGRLVLMPPGQASLEDLGDALVRQKVTTLWLTAGLFHQMADRQLHSLKGLRQLLAGGDVVSVAHVSRVLASLCGGKLINGYGPTEGTTFTCCYAMQPGDLLGHTVPIGRPISNTQVYILDRHMQPVPIGVAGELYIGGDGLARGYLNEPDLTLEKFIPNPFKEDPDAILYKTGDLARYRADGNIEFLGRLDRQVKIRGFRVEPGEIEVTLAGHPIVRDALVIAEEDPHTGQRLIAYVVSEQDVSVEVDELRNFLVERLPKHMIPSSFVFMEELPLGAQGKVERSALPAAPRPTDSSYANPRNPIEERLAVIWSELLNVPEPGIHSDFFHLGGHSLLATQLMSRVCESFNVKLPLRHLFENPTIAFLAERIAAERAAGSLDSQDLARRESVLIPIQATGSKRPFVIVPGGSGGEEELLGYERFLRVLDPDQPIYGFNARALISQQAREDSVEELARQLSIEIQRLQPDGPCYLGGECVGGIVAFEAARQLQAVGRKIAFLVLMDTICPDRTSILRYHLANVNHGVLGRMGLYRRDLGQLNVRQWGPYVMDKSRKALTRARTGWRSDTEELAKETVPGLYVKGYGDAYAKTMLRYRPLPFNGLVTLLISDDLYQKNRVQPWAEFATKGAELHVVPGNHDTYIREYAAALAECLRECLRKAQA